MKKKDKFIVFTLCSFSCLSPSVFSVLYVVKDHTSGLNMILE